MVYTIENDEIKVGIDSLGAQLASIYGKKKGVEYLWQGNNEYWKSRAPILFPICGRLVGGKYTFQGKEYEMPIHGIAKLKDFAVADKSQTAITFVFESDDWSKTFFPFDFKFSVTFSVEGSTLLQSFIVENKGYGELPFSLGLHPGFNVPLSQGEKFDDYYIEFEKMRAAKEYVFTDKGFDTGKKRGFALNDGKFDLKHSLFDIDAVFLETSADTVRLKSKKSDFSVAVSYSDMTSIGFWHTPASDAPFVCIEPWHGVPAFDGVVDDFATKNHTIKLSPKSAYSTTVSISVK